MKKYFWILVLAVGALPGFGQTIDQIAANPPRPARLVNDYAHVLTANQLEALEAKLVAYDDSTSIQIAVVTVQTTGGMGIDDAALEILRKWGVGNKKTNNGIVILAAIQDHNVFIATGQGMESTVPDITAKEIIENEVLPNFKQGNYFRGFDVASDEIIKAAAGQYKAPEGYNRRGKGTPGGSIFGLIIFVVIILILIARGRGGGGRGGMMNRSGFFPWFIASMLMNRGGGGWGGGGGGGGWSGGGGGGGFGGFGGGGGGGGGAGGSW